MARALRPWYEQIAEQLRNTACLHADETGWRVDGQTHWLWCFCDTQSCLYLIDRSRGTQALRRFFTEAFAGTLVSDFWAAYELVACDDRQYCLVHLLRELEKVDERNRSAAWPAFARLLRRLVRDGILVAQADRLHARQVPLPHPAHPPPALQAGQRRHRRRV